MFIMIKINLCWQWPLIAVPIWLKRLNKYIALASLSTIYRFQFIEILDTKIYQIVKSSDDKKNIYTMKLVEETSKW